MNKASKLIFTVKITIYIQCTFVSNLAIVSVVLGSWFGVSPPSLLVQI